MRQSVLYVVSYYNIYFRVWLNALLNNHTGVMISLEKCYEYGMNLNEFLKSIAVYMGTLSIDA